jgi:hypothetical protein
VRVEIHGVDGMRTVVNQPVVDVHGTLGGGVILIDNRGATRVTLTFDDLRYIDQMRAKLAQEKTG